MANLQNKNHNQNKFQEMKNTATQRSKTKRAKQNFLRNLQKSNFWPTQRNQESSKDLSRMPNQTKQVISKIVFYLCIARTFKVFVLLQYPLAQQRREVAFELFIVGWGRRLRLVGLWRWEPGVHPFRFWDF